MATSLQPVKLWRNRSKLWRLGPDFSWLSSKVSQTLPKTSRTQERTPVPWGTPLLVRWSDQLNPSIGFPLVDTELISFFNLVAVWDQWGPPSWEKVSKPPGLIAKETRQAGRTADPSCTPNFKGKRAALLLLLALRAPPGSLCTLRGVCTTCWVVDIISYATWLGHCHGNMIIEKGPARKPTWKPVWTPLTS
jgi:hypothetical protein